ncbi:MAG TPA: hypothetical protein DDW76_16840 [Cyanobacteria bacterium UBA11369]|nr:hypothetical protein [Cyanobacteria bacterium UBA11371]HBE29928.1 hypothetical protein [Cyanobacteria bacterium UBA11368]HBE50412.1 hypothetical protein [Cyanobacteria bacterium UBA11369]
MNNKVNWKMTFSCIGTYAAIAGLLLNGVLTAEAREWLKEKSLLKSSPIPTTNSLPATETPLSKLVAQGFESGSNNIGVLRNTRVFSDRVTSDNQEKYYSFSLDQPSNISLYLDNVTSDVSMRLYVDTNGNGVIDSGESLDSSTAYSSSTGVIGRALGADNYIVVVRFRGRNSNYNLQLVNNTTSAVNVGILKGSRTFTGSMNRNNRVKYYRFRLNNDSNVNLSLDRVTSQVSMRLHVDTNGNGVIDSGESVDSATAYSSSSSGVIRRRLGADNYFVVIGQNRGNTNYRLTMFSP